MIEYLELGSFTAVAFQFDSLDLNHNLSKSFGLRDKIVSVTRSLHQKMKQKKKILSSILPLPSCFVHQDAGLALVDATDLHSASEVSSGVRWCSLVLERLAYDHWKVFFYVFVRTFVIFLELLWSSYAGCTGCIPPSSTFHHLRLLLPPTSSSSFHCVWS